MEKRKRSSKACEPCRTSKLKCDVAESGPPCSRCRLRSAGGEGQCRLIPSKRGRRSQVTTSRLTRRSTVTAEEQNHQRAMASECPPSTNTTPFQGSTVVAGTSQPTSLIEDADQATMPPSKLSSWKTAFESILRASRRGTPTSGPPMFIGASFPLAAMLRRQGYRHHQIPQAEHDQQSRSSGSADLTHDAKTFLESTGCLGLPPKTCVNALLPIFLEKFCPIYPIIDHEDFSIKQRNGSLPLILVHAICGTAASFCSLAQLTPLGFSSREEARETFYRRAKYLFDFKYERDRITLLQTCILLSFWPSVGPQDIWSTYHWIGFAVSLAESMGLHRSLGDIDIPARTKSLLKRIWWVLVFRDAFGAILFGRPLRIDESQCDADVLSVDDLKNNETTDPNRISSKPAHMDESYFVHATTLIMLLRPIYRHRVRPRSNVLGYSFDVDGYKHALFEWQAALPHDVVFRDGLFSSPLSAKVLSVLHHITTLLLASLAESMPSRTGVDIAGAPENSSSLSKDARASADSILAIGSSITTQDQLTLVPQELFIGIFLSAVTIVQHNDISTGLVASQMETFQLVFHQIKEYWRPAVWIMHMFSTLAELQRQDQGVAAIPTDMRADLLANLQSHESYPGDFSFLDDNWPSNGLFSTLFEQ